MQVSQNKNNQAAKAAKSGAKHRSLINSLPAVARFLGDNRKVQVRISGTGAYTNGELINIPVLPDGPEALVLARGYLDHEAGHIRCTDFEVQRKPGLGAWLANALEDVRIERLMGETFPGCKRNLEELVTLLVSQDRYLSLPEEGEIKPTQAFGAWMAASLRSSVLGHSACQSVADASMEVLEEIFPARVLDELMDLAIEGSMAESTQAVVDTAEKMVAVLEGWEREMQNPPKPPPPPPGEEEPGEGEDGGGGSADENQPGEPGDGSGGEGSGQPGDPDDGSGEGSGGKADGQDQGTDSGNGSGPDQDQPGQGKTKPGKGKAKKGKGKKDAQADQGQDEQEGQGQGAGGGGGADAVRDILAASEGDFQGTDLGEALVEALGEMAQDAPAGGRVALPSERRAPAGRMDVHEVRAETASLRGRLAGLIQASRYQSSFPQKSGRRIEAGALSRLAVKDPRVFRQEHLKVGVNTAVAIILDRSGSMCGTEIEVASKATLAAALALDSISGVTVGTAAFPGHNETEVLVMTDFGQKVLPTANHYGVGANGGTPLDSALNWAGVRLVNRPEPRKICLVMTDGCPNDQASAIRSVGLLEASGIEVYGIGIMHKAVEETIKKSVVINSISELPQALFGVLQRELTRK